MAASWKLTLSLFVLFFAYLFFGGWLFRYCEKDNEQVHRKKLQETYVKLHEAVSESGCISKSQILDFLHTITGKTDLEASGNETDVKWDYFGAFFFSFTVLSTIGYGTLAPATRAGRIAFLFYGLIGIPLFLMLLNSIADHSKDLHTRLREKHAHHHTFLSIMFYVLAALLLFFLPSAVVAHVEGWTYVDAVYFSFQTLATVGFGDLVPGITNIEHGIFPRAYRIFIIIWVILGLAYMSALMSYILTLDMRFFQAVAKWKDQNGRKFMAPVVQAKNAVANVVAEQCHANRTCDQGSLTVGDSQSENLIVIRFV